MRKKTETKTNEIFDEGQSSRTISQSGEKRFRVEGVETEEFSQAAKRVKSLAKEEGLDSNHNILDKLKSALNEHDIFAVKEEEKSSKKTSFKKHRIFYWNDRKK